MQGDPPTEARAPTGAVFLSYASQDTDAARRICDALRAAGIEVWFDQSELRGGDAWDQSIRKQIKTCALFLAVISHTTHDRREGYFRLEWKLAVDRCHLMDADMAFLLPVVIDDTRDDDERVPERFREVQWTRLPGGETSPAFVERVQRLLSGDTAQEPSRSASVAVRPSAPPTTKKPFLASWRSKTALLATIAVLVVALGYLATNRLEPSKPGSEIGAASAPAAQSTATTAFSPPPHSIAVLPFVNMSGEKEQEYFSDGLSEELLNSLSRINELQVAARSSSFYFKGEHVDLQTIAHKLNVASVLEGSVRRAGHKIRITAQLNSAVSGFHLWSQTYDRDLSDVFALQTEIANAVASSLKITLLGDVAAKIEAGGTRNPGAFDAYLRASKAYRDYQNDRDLQAAIAGYTEAISVDPGYALAYADRSLAFQAFGRNFAAGARRDNFDKAQVDSEKAIDLAPSLAAGHLALASLLEHSLDFIRAGHEYEKALALEPGNARLLGNYAWFAVLMGHTEAGVAAAHRAVALDPLNSNNHVALGEALVNAHRYRDAVAALTDALTLTPHDAYANSWLGYAYYQAGDFQNARAAFESVQAADAGGNRLHGLAMAYDKLGRHADAETMLTQFRASNGDQGAVFYAMVYAQWGDTARALDSLEVAMRQQDPYLEYVKVNALLDPLRKEPRFHAILRELNFPD